MSPERIWEQMGQRMAHAVWSMVEDLNKAGMDIEGFILVITDGNRHYACGRGNNDDLAEALRQVQNVVEDQPDPHDN